MFFNLTPPQTMLWLYQALIVEKKTVKEFEIIQAWRSKGWLPEGCMSSELALFRTHFFIFHQLYTLKVQALREQLGHLDIHTLGTRLHLVPDSNKHSNKTTLSQVDGLLVYYLDWRPLFCTQTEQIAQLMAFAQAGFARQQKLQSAFTRFQITPLCNWHSVKKAYRRLAAKYHPDKGGSVEIIQAINEEKALLMRWFQHQ